MCYWKVGSFIFIVFVMTNNHYTTNRDAKKKLTISYPCVMLNVDVARKNTNDQYQVAKMIFIDDIILVLLSFC